MGAAFQRRRGVPADFRGCVRTEGACYTLKRMAVKLQQVLDTLRAHEAELRRMGVTRAAIFGSVARGEETNASDVDVLVDLSQDQSIGIFEYSRVRLYLNELLGGTADIANRHTLKPLLRANILREAIDAF